MKDTSISRSDAERIILEACAYYSAQAILVFGTLVHDVGIAFDVRGRMGGWACSKDCKVRLNLGLLAYEGEEACKQTAGHELAHFVTHRKFGRGAHPHGAEWKAVMLAFGLPPKRCHSYDVRAASEYEG